MSVYSESRVLLCHACDGRNLWKGYLTCVDLIQHPKDFCFFFAFFLSDAIRNIPSAWRRCKEQEKEREWAKRRVELVDADWNEPSVVGYVSSLHETFVCRRRIKNPIPAHFPSHQLALKETDRGNGQAFLRPTYTVFTLAGISKRREYTQSYYYRQHRRPRLAIVLHNMKLSYNGFSLMRLFFLL